MHNVLRMMKFTGTRQRRHWLVGDLDKRVKAQSRFMNEQKRKKPG